MKLVKIVILCLAITFVLCDVVGLPGTGKYREVVPRGACQKLLH